MLRVTSSRCPHWDATPLAKAFGLSCQPSRTAATLQKRKPSRMQLSGRVAHAARKTDDGGKPVARRTRNSPFGGMNTTQVPQALQYQKNQISAAERKRQTRMKPGKEREAERKDPMKALKMQRRLANVSYERRTKVKQDLLDRDSFDDFHLLPAVKQSLSAQALGGLTDVSPTPIQRLAIPALLGTEDGKRRQRKGKATADANKSMDPFLLAAETGSGKTLAYVLPVVDAIKRAEIEESAQAEVGQAREIQDRRTSGRTYELPGPDVDQLNSAAGRPRAIILLPTSELVLQVGALLKSLSHVIKFRTAMISASFSGTVIRNRLFSPGGVDVVVSTPHLLSSITESDPNILSRVSHLIIDEADSLLDRSFSPITSAIIDRAAPSLQQLIFCSATIPRSMDSYLNKRYPEVKRLATPNLHAIPRRVQLSVVDVEKVPYQGNRDLACAQTIWDIGKEVADAGEDREKKIVVFVNEREKTTEVTNYLRSKGIDAVALSRDSDERKQAETLAAFTGAVTHHTKQAEKAEPIEPTVAFSPGGLAEDDVVLATTRRLGNTKVLVMTDIGSRGIDTLLVRHVILYDVPHTSIDFIHRLGRVGRMGRRGRGIVLVGKNDRKDIVKEVREGMFKGQALI